MPGSLDKNQRGPQKEKIEARKKKTGVFGKRGLKLERFEAFAENGGAGWNGGARAPQAPNPEKETQEKTYTIQNNSSLSWVFQIIIGDWGKKRG